MSTAINKPWGKEIIVTDPNSPYTGKLLYIKQGNRLSLQYHDKKTETLTLLQGNADIEIDNQKTAMILFDGYTIKPLQKHRVSAKTNCYVMEVSTSEEGTTFRVEDDYNRSNETPDIRNLPNRGWQT